MREAAIDNDFVLHLAEINWQPEELYNKVKIYFSGMDLNPMMHELVYSHELDCGTDNDKVSRALEFFRLDVIKIKKIKSFLETDVKKKYYEVVFKEIYRDFRGDIPEGLNNIFIDWKSHASLGETHTIAMCFVIGCDVFLSDDGDSKKLARILESKKAFTINVYTRSEAMEKLKKDFSKLGKHDRRALKHRHTH